jgi:hypothetical protein
LGKFIKKDNIRHILKKIGEQVYDVAVKEDLSLLESSGKGIFFVPELAFAYLCGKSIMENRKKIFGDLDAVWTREVNLGSDGPTDMVIELSSGISIAIEFKLRDTATAYVKDLEKLSRLSGDQYIKTFCALIDTFTKSLPGDGRIAAIESIKPNYKVESILKPNPFATKQDWYAGEVSCVVGFWEVTYI